MTLSEGSHTHTNPTLTPIRIRLTIPRTKIEVGISK